VAQLVTNFPSLREPEMSLMCSQRPTTRPYLSGIQPGVREDILGGT